MYATQSHPIARALFVAGLALAGTVASFAATTSTAHAAGVERYRAQLSTALAEPKSKVVSGVVWNCKGASCSGEVDGSRPINTCIKVVKAFGPVASFSTPKGEFTADELASCNAGRS